jgi:hypothetical protein
MLRDMGRCPMPRPTRLDRSPLSALEHIRVGNYAAARPVLRAFRRTKSIGSKNRPPTDQTKLLRLATLQAELADHDGKYEEARTALALDTWVRGELVDTPFTELAVVFDHRREPAWKLLRQKTYYLWQLSVAAYRRGSYRESEQLLTVATNIAKAMKPAAQGLLTQLYYGRGKVALHDSDFGLAATMYRKSLANAAELLTAHRQYLTATEAVATRDQITHEIRAAEYASEPSVISSSAMFAPRMIEAVLIDDDGRARPSRRRAKS